MRKGLETKQNLIAATIDLAAEKGLQWVSFQQIGSKVGVAQSSLYKYFQDKDDLVLACLAYVAATGRELIDGNIDPLKDAFSQIKGYLEGNFRWVQERPKDASILFAAYYFATNNDPIRQQLLTINRQSVSRLGIHIAAGAREGLWSQGDLEKNSRLIHSLLIAEMFKAMHAPEEMDLSARTQLVCDAAKKILG